LSAVEIEDGNPAREVFNKDLVDISVVKTECNGTDAGTALPEKGAGIFPAADYIVLIHYDARVGPGFFNGRDAAGKVCRLAAFIQDDSIKDLITFRRAILIRELKLTQHLFQFENHLRSRQFWGGI
jgi:hypothetical protein